MASGTGPHSWPGHEENQTATLAIPQLLTQLTESGARALKGSFQALEANVSPERQIHLIQSASTDIPAWGHSLLEEHTGFKSGNSSLLFFPTILERNAQSKIRMY